MQLGSSSSSAWLPSIVPASTSALYGVGRLEEARSSAAVLDPLPDALGVVDGAGRIITVKNAWRMFAVDDGGRPETTGVGVHDVAVCGRAADAGCADAAKVADGLRSVLGAEPVRSELEHPAPRPDASSARARRVGCPHDGRVMTSALMVPAGDQDWEMSRAVSAHGV